MVSVLVYIGLDICLSTHPFLSLWELGGVFEGCLLNKYFKKRSTLSEPVIGGVVCVSCSFGFV